MLDHPILSPILVRRGADSSHNWGPSGLLGSFSDLTKFRGFPSRALNYGFGVFLRLLAPISVPCFPSCLAPSLQDGPQVCVLQLETRRDSWGPRETWRDSWGPRETRRDSRKPRETRRARIMRSRFFTWPCNPPGIFGYAYSPLVSGFWYPATPRGVFGSHLFTTGISAVPLSYG